MNIAIRTSLADLLRLRDHMQHNLQLATAYQTCNGGNLNKSQPRKIHVGVLACLGPGQEAPFTNYTEATGSLKIAQQMLGMAMCQGLQGRTGLCVVLPPGLLVEIYMGSAVLQTC